MNQNIQYKHTHTHTDVCETIYSVLKICIFYNTKIFIKSTYNFVLTSIKHFFYLNHIPIGSAELIKYMNLKQILFDFKIVSILSYLGLNTSCHIKDICSVKHKSVSKIKLYRYRILCNRLFVDNKA